MGCSPHGIQKKEKSRSTHVDFLCYGSDVLGHLGLLT